MITTDRECAAKTNDARLVAESLAGDRDAFRQIVERHQTLVCSLAYCATGSLTRSEDLAQETFLAAWRQLAELREPSKLRPWLCGIARFIIGKELRRLGREPVHAAETLEMADEFPGTEPLPSDHVISKEEEALLWHCLASVPEIYREPLVLFYREHQSIACVADALMLSEDAVKQRLARGRKLLQERALAFVEGRLQHTVPGSTFTTGVLAALPFAAVPAKAVSLAAALKGSSTAKTIAGLAAVGAIILYWSLVGFQAFVGACAGYWMSRSCDRSPKQCENVIRFWRTLAGVFALSFLTRWLMFTLYLVHGPAFFPGWFLWRLCEDLTYVLAVGALAAWMHRWWREFYPGTTDAQELPRRLKRRFTLWLSLGMIIPSCCLMQIVVPLLWHTFGPPAVQHLSEAEMAKVINDRRDATFIVMGPANGTTTLEVTLPPRLPDFWKRWLGGMGPAWWNLWISDQGSNWHWWSDLMEWTGWRPVRLSAVADDSTIKLLKQEGIHYGSGHIIPMARETWPFNFLLPFFIVPMGAMMIFRQTRKGRRISGGPAASHTPEAENKHDRMLLTLRTDPMARRVFCRAFAIAFALIFTANAFATTQTFTALGLYVVLFLGSVKGAFFGLVTGVGILYLRIHRQTSKPHAGI